MNEQGRTPRRGLDETLREALHDTHEDFDYDALVAGVHRRATRIRRRRTVGTLAAAAVLGPALVGGAMVLPDLVEDRGGQVPPASTSDDNGLVTTRGTATSEPTTPPWQDEEPVAPPGGMEQGSIPNAWDIPDARPTGVDLLDGLGAPKLAMSYPRTPALMSVMVCDPPNEGGMEPESAQSWSYYADGSTAAVDIQVTGWADSRAAMEGLAAGDDTLLCAWDPPPTAASWDGHEGDAGYYLNEPYRNGEDWLAAAAVRQGDYIVGVTVRHPDRHAALTGATEISVKTAENLEVLDPEHGQDEGR